MPLFRGAAVRLVRPDLDEVSQKELTFWHLIQESAKGPVRNEDNRIPDPRRCERIRWPRAIIEHTTDAAVQVWETDREGKPRICLWLEEAEYLVVMAKRKCDARLLTAYTTEREHTKAKLRKESSDYKKTLK